jgi:hypothetical protein
MLLPSKERRKYGTDLQQQIGIRTMFGLKAKCHAELIAVSNPREIGSLNVGSSFEKFHKSGFQEPFNLAILFTQKPNTLLGYGARYVWGIIRWRHL